MQRGGGKVNIEHTAKDRLYGVLGDLQELRQNVIYLECMIKLFEEVFAQEEKEEIMCVVVVLKLYAYWLKMQTDDVTQAMDEALLKLKK